MTLHSKCYGVYCGSTNKKLSKNLSIFVDEKWYDRKVGPSRTKIVIRNNTIEEQRNKDKVKKL